MGSDRRPRGGIGYGREGGACATLRTWRVCSVSHHDNKSSDLGTLSHFVHIAVRKPACADVAQAGWRSLAGAWCRLQAGKIEDPIRVLALQGVGHRQCGHRRVAAGRAGGGICMRAVIVSELWPGSRRVASCGAHTTASHCQTGPNCAPLPSPCHSSQAPSTCPAPTPPGPPPTAPTHRRYPASSSAVSTCRAMSWGLRTLPSAQGEAAAAGTV